MNCLERFETPQLTPLHSGKVRDSFRVDADRRLIAVTDRISAFDQILGACVPFKGAVLNGISNFWFERTRDIVGNHILGQVDPNINTVREAKPIRVEMIVRAYLTGSMWRGYEKGKRCFSGVKVPDGLRRNDRFPTPIVTPTTKEDQDREIVPEEIITSGLANEQLYREMERVALKLFAMGSEHLAKQGIILVDTKYEFGLVDGELILIDEIHTPDSSRFWRTSEYEGDREGVESVDKEFVRQWLLSNRTSRDYHSALPPDVVNETSRRYLEIYSIITGSKLETDSFRYLRQRITANLSAAEIIQDAYVMVIMGSPGDHSHASYLGNAIEAYGVRAILRVVSAHKNGERIPAIARRINNSVEPGSVIAVAGRSNGLGGALSANLNVPVINCPPFKDSADLMLNVNSSLMMPSRTPAATVIDPKNAAACALRALNLPRLRSQFSGEIENMKSELEKANENE